MSLTEDKKKSNPVKVVIAVFGCAVLLYGVAVFLFYHKTVGALKEETVGIKASGFYLAGLQTFGFQEIRYQNQIPVNLVFRRVTLTTNLIRYFFSKEQQIQVRSGGGQLTIGSSDVPLEGFVEKEFNLLPFEIKLKSRGTDFSISPFSIQVDKFGSFDGSGEFSKDLFEFKATAVFLREFLNSVPNPIFFSYAVNPEEGLNELSVTANGEWETPQIHIHSKLIDLKLRQQFSIL